MATGHGGSGEGHGGGGRFNGINGWYNNGIWTDIPAVCNGAYLNPIQVAAQVAACNGNAACVSAAQQCSQPIIIGGVEL